MSNNKKTKKSMLEKIGLAIYGLLIELLGIGTIVYAAINIPTLGIVGGVVILTGIFTVMYAGGIIGSIEK